MPLNYKKKIELTNKKQTEFIPIKHQKKHSNYKFKTQTPVLLKPGTLPTPKQY